MRGAITVAFLERLETLAAQAGTARLADAFQLIGGTSTGAVIGGALALGYSASDVREFYLSLAPKVFKRPRWWLWGVQSLFDAAPLVAEIERVVGERTLGSADLITNLAIVMKRMDTGSAWVVTNNPNAQYWNDPADGSYLGNRHYKLKHLIRASTAAPHFFAPELIPILSDQTPGLFVDGGVTPHNNPALLMAMVATLPAYGFGWPLGPDALSIVSIGTGRYRNVLPIKKSPRIASAELAIRALAGLIVDCEDNTLALCQWLGQTDRPAAVNSEIGTMEGPKPPPLFRFTRYDVDLNRVWLSETLDINVTEAEMKMLWRIEDPAAIPLAYQIGRVAAERFVTLPPGFRK